MSINVYLLKIIYMYNEIGPCDYLQVDLYLYVKIHAEMGALRSPILVCGTRLTITKQSR